MKIKTSSVVIGGLLALCALGLVAAWRIYSRSSVPAGRSSGDFAATVTSFYATPSTNPDVAPLELTQEAERFFAEMDQRAQDLYGSQSYRYGGEIMNLLFAQAFPDAHMYTIGIAPSGTDSGPAQHVMMVSLADKDYQMPADFNQLMFDAGYTSVEENRDLLAQALIVATLPTRMIMEPVTCGPGREIDEPVSEYSTRRYGYEMHCHIAYEDSDVVVKFSKPGLGFEDQFWCVDGFIGIETLFAGCPTRLSREE